MPMRVRDGLLVTTCTVRRPGSRSLATTLWQQKDPIVLVDHLIPPHRNHRPGVQHNCRGAYRRIEKSCRGSLVNIS